MIKEELILSLIDNVTRGNEEAFSQLYDITHKKVYLYLYRLLNDKDAAEDVLVETFTEVWKGAKSFRGNSMVTTWIMGIARNLAMNEIRKTKTHESIDNHKHLSNSTMLDDEISDKKRILRKALSVLSSNHSEVLDLVFFHEMSYLEVSETLNIPVNTVKTRVFYAKDALKEALNSMGVKKNDI